MNYDKLLFNNYKCFIEVYEKFYEITYEFLY